MEILKILTGVLLVFTFLLTVYGIVRGVINKKMVDTLHRGKTRLKVALDTIKITKDERFVLRTQTLCRVHEDIRDSLDVMAELYENKGLLSLQDVAIFVAFEYHKYKKLHWESSMVEEKQYLRIYIEIIKDFMKDSSPYFTYLVRKELRRLRNKTSK